MECSFGLNKQLKKEAKEMLKKIDTFLKKTKILRLPVAMLVALIAHKTLASLFTVAAILDGYVSLL